MADEENINTPPANTENQTVPNANESEPPQDMDVVQIEDGIRKDEARLSILQEEYNSMADKIHDEFETQLEKNPTSLFSDEELEILASDSNIAAKNKMLRDRFEKYRDEKLETKKQEIGKFEDQLKGRRGEFEILTESNKFSKENPDVDMEAFAEFIQEDLSPRKKKEFRDAAKTKYEFLKLAHEEYKRLNPEENDDDDNLPPDLSNVNGATGDNSYSNDEEKKAYLKSIGIGR
jgi:hypothetical protein